MEKGDEELKSKRKELLSAFLAFFVKLVGETVKDKLARTLVVGAVAAAGYYFDIAPGSVDINPLVQSAQSN